MTIRGRNPLAKNPEKEGEKPNHADKGAELYVVAFDIEKNDSPVYNYVDPRSCCYCGCLRARDD